MTPRESMVEAEFGRSVRQAGGSSFKLVTYKGIPDRMVLMPGGRFYLVELKATDGRIDPAQQLWSDRAEALGHRVHYVWGMQGVLDFMAAYWAEVEAEHEETWKMQA